MPERCFRSFSGRLRDLEVVWSSRVASVSRHLGSASGPHLALGNQLLQSPWGSGGLAGGTVPFRIFLLDLLI